MRATFRNALLAAAAMATLGAGSPEGEPVRYRLTPVMKGQALQALEVEIRFRGDADGETLLYLPDRWAGEKELWRQLSGFEAEGASVVENGPAARVLTHAPGAPLKVRYRVVSAYAEDPQTGRRHPFRPIVRPTWFHVLGEAVFATPADRDDRPARFEWGGGPRDWTLASDMEHGARGRPLAVRDIRDSVALGGADVVLHERENAGAPLRLAMRGEWTFGGEELFELVARVVEAERGFWKDGAEPYFVSVLPLGAQEGSMSIGGTGRSDGYALYASTNAEGPMLRYVLAHEHAHSWFPDRLGRMPDRDQASAYWFSEGFTDFQTVRGLLRSGVWTPEEFAELLNEKLAAYAASPVREAPNSRIAADFWADAAVHDLPYQRGLLLALVWDYRLRQASGGRLDLDDVLLAMRAKQRRAGPAEAPLATQAFSSVYRELSGLDLAADYQRHVEGGAAVLLPKDLFGACAEVRTETLPVFERGWDADATTAAGNVVTGLKPDSPAYAAGLRDGMKIVRREAGQVGDSRVDYVLRVIDGGAERLIRFRPEGKGEVTRQTVVLAPGLDEASRAACARRMSGA